MERKIVAIIYDNGSKCVGCIEEKEENKIILQYNNGKEIKFKKLSDTKKELNINEFISIIEPYDAAKFSHWMLDHV